MKTWKRLSICITLSLVLLVGILANNWNKSKAELCPLGMCCVTGSAVYTTSSGSEIVLVSTTCGTYSYIAFSDGGFLMIVCPDNSPCVSLTF